MGGVVVGRLIEKGVTDGRPHRRNSAGRKIDQAMVMPILVMLAAAESLALHNLVQEAEGGEEDEEDEEEEDQEEEDEEEDEEEEHLTSRDAQPPATTSTPCTKSDSLPSSADLPAQVAVAIASRKEAR